MNKILIIGMLFLGQCAFAQVADTIKDLPAEQVEVIKQFQARLENAKKVNTIPEPPAQRVLQAYEYGVSIKPLRLEYLEPSIRPIALETEQYPKKRNGFAQFAAGNINTLDASLGYHFMTKNETEAYVNAEYLTQENQNERFQKYSHLKTALGAQHNFNELVSFGIGGGFQQKNVFFYGSPVDEFTGVDSSAFARNIRDYGFGFQLFNAAENEYDLDYHVSFDYHNLSLVDENLIENNFVIGAEVDKAFNDNVSFTFHGSADISSILDTATLTYNNYHITPVIHYHSEDLGFHGGVDFAFGPEGQNYYLPDVELSYSFADYFTPYAFWKGELQKNNLIPLFRYNPFLSASVSVDLVNSVVNRYGGGIRGKSKGWYYDLRVGYGNTADLMLFRNNLTDEGLRQFTLQNDTSQVLEINANVIYEWSDQLKFMVGFEYNYYDITAWHLPTYRFNFSVDYTMLDNRLTIQPALFIRDGVIVLNDDREAEELPYMLDVNLRVKYAISKIFDVYGEVNNLLASEYQQWYDYSNFGLNAKVGLRAKF